MIEIPILKIVSAMTTIQSRPSEIESAARAHALNFSVYVVLLVVTALVLAFFTWRVWKTGNGLQDAIRRDAEARIQEAKAEIARLELATRNEQQRLEKEQQKTAQAQKEAAEAQLALKKYVEEVELRQRPRMLDSRNFVNALKDKPKATVEILYKSDDQEAYLLAGQIRRWLGPGEKGDGVGWDVRPPKPISPSDRSNLKLPDDAPLATRLGAWHGLALIANKGLANPLERETNLGALLWALVESNLMPVGPWTDSSLPDNFFRIIVGQKLY